MPHLPMRATPRRGLVATVAGFGLVAATVGASGAAAADTSADTSATPFAAGNYVVTLVGDPAATYDGDIAGLPATEPDQGEHLDADSAPVQKYQRYLEKTQDQLADSVGADPKYQYTAVINGFSATLTAKQATKLATTKGVLAVTPDEARSVDTIHSPAFLGLPGDDGVWSSIGGVDQAGKGVVVGDIDTGITPENPSFAGDPVTATAPDGVGSTYRAADGGIAVQKADGTTFEGACQAAATFTADDCTSKIVSARYFASGFLATVDPSDYSPYEEISPRDGAGHGSHTAGTAVGNNGVDMTVEGRDFGQGSGMAPAAKLAVYKVCWEDDDEETGGCYTSDSVAAIDQAVLDGVDVLNYSISGALDTSFDPVELAFLSAASAGVFVAASAGNSGPGASTVAHNSPWLTTVAASTSYNYLGTATLGDGEKYRGASNTSTSVPQTPAVISGDVGLAAADPAQVALCYPGTLDPAQVTGKVVVCDRGVNPRVDKSRAVAEAGGVGMVLVNTTPSSEDADLHSVPTVHVDVADGEAIKSYVSTATDPTIAIAPGDQTDLPPVPLPVTASFSSRGPALANGGDLLKPDISAPGVSILAAVAPGPNSGRDFDFYSGTSMSSPHIAGLGALILGVNPGWSPMEVKSAMMTTAYDVKNQDGSTDTNHFDQGAGHVDPTKFLTPGLVYDSGPTDWIAFLEGAERTDLVDGIDPIDPSELNQPSIAVGELAGAQTVTRTVTATTPGLYRAQVSLPGFSVKVTPSVLAFTQPGQSKSFKVTMTRTSAPLDTYAQGNLTWTGRGVTVRSPIVAQPVALSAPDEVQGTVAAKKLSYQVTPGSTGPIGLTLSGMTPGRRINGTVPAGEQTTYSVDVPAGTTLARARLTAGEGSDDLDLYVFDGTGALIASSATGAADETVTVQDPEPGRYTVLVDGYSTAPSGGAFTLDEFAVAGPAGNATVTPKTLAARQGQAATVTVSYPKLKPGVPYLGWVGYGDTGDLTIVQLD